MSSDNPTPSNHDPWLSREEAAEYARVTTRTIDRARRAGRLRWVKPDGRVLFRRSWIDAWLSGGAMVAIVNALLALTMAWAVYCHCVGHVHGLDPLHWCPGR